jgi:hypothetical protein
VDGHPCQVNGDERIVRRGHNYYSPQWMVADCHGYSWSMLTERIRDAQVPPGRLSAAGWTRTRFRPLRVAGGRGCRGTRRETNGYERWVTVLLPGPHGALATPTGTTTAAARAALVARPRGTRANPHDQHGAYVGCVTTQQWPF